MTIAGGISMGGVQPSGPQNFDSLLSVGDVDNDSSLNKGEFKAILEEKLGNKFDETRFNKMFSEMSGDDGLVSGDEFNLSKPKRGGHNPPPPPLPLPEFDTMISEFDIDGDGKISLSEFEAMIKAQPGKNINEEKITEMFSNLAVDDGLISKDSYDKMTTNRAERDGGHQRPPFSEKPNDVKVDTVF